MAATLASVCSVPLTSVLLLFELTKDYRILLPLMVVYIGFALFYCRIIKYIHSGVIMLINRELLV
jgi:H+/Cl- antiporter ClcA